MLKTSFFIFYITIIILLHIAIIRIIIKTICITFAVTQFVIITCVHQNLLANCVFLLLLLIISVTYIYFFSTINDPSHFFVILPKFFYQ